MSYAECSLAIRIYNNWEAIMNPVEFRKLADQIVRTNDLDAYKSFSDLMAHPRQVELVFDNLQGSQNLLFVACEVLSKKVINKEFYLNSDDADHKELGKLDADARRNTLVEVSQTIYTVLLRSSSALPRHLINSCLNTISACIKATIVSISSFDPIFLRFLGIIQPTFVPNQEFVHASSSLTLICPFEGMSLPTEAHEYTVRILSSVMEFIVNSTYFENYYYFRRNIYFFRNHYLPYFLNYAVFSLKVLFSNHNRLMSGHPSMAERQQGYQRLRGSLQLLEAVVMYPFSLNMHEGEVEDEIHDNISGSATQIYFPSCFRNFLCDEPLLMDLVGYYSSLMKDSENFDSIREDCYCLVRTLGRSMSASEYVFCSEEERRSFRGMSVQFAINILTEQRYNDTYLILCVSKINSKIVASFSKLDFNEYKQTYFQTLMTYIKKIISLAPCKIEDGEKHPIRQAFDLMISILDHTELGMILEADAKVCGQEALDLLYLRLTDNDENKKMMQEFGSNNRLEVECFQQIFGAVPKVFKLNIEKNLEILRNLNIESLNEESITCWLHLCSLLLPSYDTSQEQTQLILKFFHVAIHERFRQSISSLHYIQTLITQILTEVEDGVSSTYLWKFMEESLEMTFETFLTKIIEYTVSILMVPSFTLIENALELFKATFTKLCRIRHRSFKRYFSIVEEVSKKIDNTMLAHPEYIKLRIDYFSVISMIWITEGQVSFVYRIITNIRKSLGDNDDYIHFLRYLTDLTGILQPVESSEVFKTLVELILMDMATLLPHYLGTPEARRKAFSQEVFLRAFVKFLLVLVNDHSYRLTIDNQTNLPFRIQEIFRPIVIEILEYDYPKKTVELCLKFIKLNPLSELLPFHKSLKEKNSPLYKGLMREYFENLHRLRTIEDFYYMYTYIEDNVEFMTDWWEEIMNRGWEPDINLGTVVQARIWTTSRQKEAMGKLLYRIANYDPRYWALGVELPNENKYAEWFSNNYN